MFNYIGPDTMIDHYAAWIERVLKVILSELRTNVIICLVSGMECMPVYGGGRTGIGIVFAFLNANLSISCQF